MPTPDDPWQRQRWLRHDAHLWVRPDAARFLPPGMDPADVYPTLARQRDQLREREEVAFAAQVAKCNRVLATLRAELAEIRAELAQRRAADQNESKYSPSQPRVPAGNPDGGQWTDRGSGQNQGTSVAQPMGNVDVGESIESNELSDLFQIKPRDASVVDDQVAAERPGGYPVDLLEERELGGHAIERHVGKSADSLSNAIRGAVDYARRNGLSISDMAESSFSSLEAANKLSMRRLQEIPISYSALLMEFHPRKNLIGNTRRPRDLKLL